MKNKINESSFETTVAVEKEKKRDRERESYSLLNVRKNCDLIKLNKLII